MEKETNAVTEPTETAATPPAAETDVKPDAADKGAAGTAEGTGAGKTYDQAYIDKLLADQKAARDAAVQEALKVAGMDAEGKAAYEKEKAEKDLADREAGIALRELKADAREVLAENGIPASFLDVLVGKDLEETKANAGMFKKQFDAAVQAQVEKRLSGKTPSGGNGGGSPSEAEAMAAEIEKYLG